MKVRKILVVSLSVLHICLVGCNLTKPTMTSSVNSEPASSSIENNPSEKVSSLKHEPVSSSLKQATPKKPSSKKSQNDNEWVVYSNSKDSYKLHKKKKDGTEDKVILDETVKSPCVAGEWVYYLANLDEIYKIKLDGSQKTKVCDTDAFQVYNVNVNAYHGLNGSTSVTAEYRDGYILYTCFQLHEVGDKPNPPSYYKLDLKQNKLIPVK